MDVLTQISLVLFTSCIGLTVANDNLIDDLVTRIEALEQSKCVKQDEFIQSLRSELFDIKQDLANKERRLQFLENFIKPTLPSNDVQNSSELQNNTDVREPSDAYNDLQQRTIKSHKKVETISKERIRAGRAVRTGLHVGFHATNSRVLDNLQTHQPLVFDYVLTNIGFAYHGDNGFFIAPSHGVYMFSVSAASSGDPAHPGIATELVKGGSVLASTYAKSEPGYTDQGSATIVTELQAGDAVWVRLAYPANTSMANNFFSSFTGVLLFKY